MDRRFYMHQKIHGTGRGLFVPLMIIPLMILVTAALPVFAGGQRGSSLLVQPEWLTERGEDPDLRILEIGRKLEDYDGGHIPNALYFNGQWIRTTVDGIPAMLPSVEEVVEKLESVGVSNSSTVVVYDSGSGLWATRLFWALEYLGHRDVKVLDRGLPGWVANGGELSSTVEEVQRGSFTLALQPDRLATKDWILENLEDDGVTFLDARSPQEHSGEDVRSARGGTIPGSVNVNWILNVTDDEQRAFLPIEELAEMYDSADVVKDDTVVTYCQVGMRAAHAYFALRLAGYEKVRMYDGSWVEWGNDENTPIE
jgi:thiosulfate/3-mercaptopyruvate sulfurtransferase